MLSSAAIFGSLAIFAEGVQPGLLDPAALDSGNAHFRFDATVGQFMGVARLGIKTQFLRNNDKRNNYSVFGSKFLIPADGKIKGLIDHDPSNLDEFQQIFGIQRSDGLVEIVRPRKTRNGEEQALLSGDRSGVLLGYASCRCKIGFPSTAGKSHVNFMCDKGFGTRLSTFAIRAMPVRWSPFPMGPARGFSLLHEFDKTVRRPLVRMGIAPSFSVLAKDAKIYDRFMFMENAIMMHLPRVPDVLKPTAIDIDSSGPVGLLHGLPWVTYEALAILQRGVRSFDGSFACGGRAMDEICRPFLRLVGNSEGQQQNVHYPTALFQESAPPRTRNGRIKPMAAVVEWIPNLVPLFLVNDHLGNVGENMQERLKLINVVATLLSHMVPGIRIRNLKGAHVFLKLDLPQDFQSLGANEQQHKVVDAIRKLKPQDVKIFGFEDFAVSIESDFEEVEMWPGLYSVFTRLILGLGTELGPPVEELPGCVTFPEKQYACDLYKDWKKQDYRTDKDKVTAWLKRLIDISSPKE